MNSTTNASPPSDRLQRRSRPLRVLVLGVSWPMETFIERLVTGLAAAGVELTLAPTASLARPPAAWTDRHQVRWTDDAVPRGARSFARVAAGRARGRLLDVLRPAPLLRGTTRSRHRLLGADWDVVYVPWVSVLVDAPEFMAFTSAPLVVSCRGALVTIAPWDPSRVGHRAGLERVFEVAAVAHCVSDAIVGDAAELGLDPAKARVIRPAINTADFSPRTTTARTAPLQVVGVGSLNWRKDYEHALRALRKAIDAGADLHLDLIGDGPDRHHLLFAIDDLDLGDRVRLLGKRPATEVARLLRDAHIFLHTSSSEGISNAVLEAMATGLPVVTTDAGGMLEAVRDGTDGFVVPVRHTDAIANALVTLADDAELRAAMGTAGRQRVVEHFRLDQQVAAFMELFHEVSGR